MTAEQIKEYLKIAVDMEKEIYTQEKMIADFEYTIPRLGYSRNIRKPDGIYGESASDETINAFAIGGISIVLGVAIKFLRIPLLVFGAFCIFLAICSLLAGHDEYKQRVMRHNEEVREYENALRQDSIRIENEIKRKAFLQAELIRLKDANEKTKIRLKELYASNVIHPKYQGLIPVCSLYGYFDTGVCSKLEGHEGAYNKYDTESRLDYIICKMDEVVKHLEDIKGNQYQLYAVIKDSDAKCNKLISNTNYMMAQLDGIHAQGAELNSHIANLQLTSALTLYEADCSRRELEYLNRMNELR